MSPRLPPELLLTEILALAQQGEPPLERQKLRNAFRAVCRDWYPVVDRWSEICTRRLTQIVRVTNLLATSADTGGAPLGPRVKSVFLGFYDRDGKKPERKAADKTAALLEQVTQVEKLQLEIGTQGIMKSVWWGKAVFEALAKLSDLTSFTLTKPANHSTRFKDLPAVELKRLIAAWPRLECFTHRAPVEYYHGANYANIFAGHPNLRSVNVWAALSLLQGLPSTLRSVHVGPFATGPHHSFLALHGVASQLHELCLEGCIGRGYAPTVAAARGHHDRLIASLREVRRLSFPTYAVANLAQTLAPLAHLEQLEIIAAKDRDELSASTIGSDEVVNLILDAPALRRLTLVASVVSHWTDEGRRAVKDAAGQHGVRLVDVGGWAG